MYSSRSIPPTFNPSAVIDTVELSIFWKKAGPGGRYHISFPDVFHSAPSKLVSEMLESPVISPAPEAVGVEGARPDADPE